MLDIHTIRLRHPWQCEPCDQGTLWLRPFNWPAGLTPREIARLVIDGLPEGAVVRLSGKPILAEAERWFDITRLLVEFNTLTIETNDAYSSSEAECPFDVRLEIVEG